MLFSKEFPVGIDIPIDKVQKKLHAAFNEAWGGLECYPRCYVYDTEQGCTIAHFLNNLDYEPVIHSDKTKCFFVLKPEMKHIGGNYYTAELELFFIVNLVEAKEAIEHRADEEVRRDVLNVLNMIPSINVKSVMFNQEVIFKDYAYSIIDDLQPNHCFKITLALEYDINEQICLTN